MLVKTHSRLIIGLLCALMLLVLSACSETKQDTLEEDSAITAEIVKAETDVWNKVCPICGDEVDLDGETVTYQGKVYGFGCPGCPSQFEADPEKYVNNLSEDGTEFIGG